MPISAASMWLRKRQNYQIDRSLRFNDDDSSYLSRTVGSGNRKTWTWSGWVKRGNLGTEQWIFQASDNVTGRGNFYFTSANALGFFDNVNGAPSERTTTALFRDPSAWYHLVLAADYANGTAADRVKIYVNGVIQALSGATFNNADGAINLSTYQHRMGAYTGGGNYFDGYMAEVHFIDGTALDPTSFGEFDQNGVWRPIQVSGLTYGTNGFYLSFADNTSTTTLGYDDAGSNDWTLNNFSVTAGAGNDSLEDTPTNNWCVYSPIDSEGTTLANGNLQWTASDGSGRATVALPVTGKWVWEVSPQYAGGNSGYGAIGVGQGVATLRPMNTAGKSIIYTASGQVYNNASLNAYGASYTNTDTLRAEYDADADQITFYKNGTSQGVLSTSALTKPLFPCYVNQMGVSVAVIANFGQRAFSGTPTTGYSALCTANLPTPDIANPGAYMNAVLYTGTGSSLGVTGAGFQPDLVWIKGRSGATDHALYDAVRGVQKQIESNTTTDETTEATGLTAFGVDGFTVGALAQVNTNTATYVGWCWKEGITPGFDIVTYAGTGVARTIAHNLGTTPKLIIVKARSTASTDQGWPVYHASNTAAPETDYLLLNSTAGTADLDTVWNDTAPTTTVFSVGTNALVNTNSDTYVAYLWAAVDGFSKFGSYTGNGSSDGPFVWCNLQPRYVAIKRTDTTGDWFIWDVARDTYNVATKELLANSSAAEAGTADLDVLSNGFKLRSTTAGFNASGGTYIFMAFAEQPFINARAR